MVDRPPEGEDGLPSGGHKVATNQIIGGQISTRNSIHRPQMDERTKSATIIDVKDCTKQREFILVGRV